MEAKAKNKQRSSEEEGLHMPGNNMRSSRRLEGSGRSHWNQEAF